MYLDEFRASNGEGICNLFASFFGSAYTNLDLPNLNPIIPNVIDSFSSIIIEDSDILKFISEIKDNGSPGPDGIHPFFIKNCSSQLIQPLKYLFNKSISSGCFPNKFKESYILPIHKSGTKNMISNYRPITILTL